MSMMVCLDLGGMGMWFNYGNCDDFNACIFGM